MVDKKVGVGMVGLGSISFVHEAGFVQAADRCQIVAMCDINASEAKSRASAYDARAYTRYAELLADPQVDMVDIIVPHELHHEITLAALSRSKHVLVEKPIAVNSRQGAEMIRKARQAGVKFSVAENTRFVTAYLEAEKMLKKGALGEIWTVRTLIAGSEVHRIKDPYLWHGKAPYGGVILDSAVHSFYLLKWLFGGVKDMLAFASKVFPSGEMEDNGLILGHLANGAEFQLNVSCTMEIPWTERLEIYGSKGGLIVEQLADPVMKFYQGSNDLDGTVVPDVPFDPLAWKYNSITIEMADFISAILEDRPPSVDPLDALYALQAVEAAGQSILTKQPVTMA